MVIFREVSWKNFLSTGNAGTTIKLNDYPTTLVQGVSGSGKSTMIDALCFGLYGKPFRDINKPGLINSINGKKTEVVVEFKVGDVDYKVIRGIKPARFEIYCNNKLINQDAALKDYQKVLEQQILGMSFKTFTQISILGSTAYTPFMELSPAHRRSVIEDILDIGIFSIMNQLLKQQMQETKDLQVTIDSDLKSEKTRAEGLQKLINVLSNKQISEIDEIRTSIDKITNEVELLDAEMEALIASTAPLKERTAKLGELIATSTSLLEDITIKSSEWEHLSANINFFNDNDMCPTCDQGIDKKHKQKKITTLSGFLADIQDDIDKQTENRKIVRDQIEDLGRIANDVTTNTQRILQLKTSIQLLQARQLTELAKLQEKSEVSDDVVDAKRELKDAAKMVLSLIDKKKELSFQKELQESAAILLRDTGIKTAIIREYLPLINKLLNKYLNDMELFVEFHLDEAFNEVIKSRHRDEFTYGNFSAGEQLRIDLSLLLTWRHIAKLKNSASCNILILDEIITGRLDNENVNQVFNIISELANNGTNVFCIAHGDNLQDKFTKVLTFEKNKGFSEFS